MQRVTSICAEKTKTEYEKEIFSVWHNFVPAVTLWLVYSKLQHKGGNLSTDQDVCPTGRVPGNPCRAGNLMEHPSYVSRHMVQVGKG